MIYHLADANKSNSIISRMLIIKIINLNIIRKKKERKNVTLYLSYNKNDNKFINRLKDNYIVYTDLSFNDLNDNQT